MRPHPLRTLWLFAALLVGLPGAWAQATGDNFDILLLRWDFQLDMVELELERETLNRTLLEALLPQIEKVAQDAEFMRDEAEAKAAEVRKLLGTLGPAPAPDDPAEEDSIARRRSELQAQLVGFETQQKQSDLTTIRATHAEAKIRELVFANFTEIILERGPSPLSLAVLLGAGPQFLGAMSQLLNAPAEEWAPVLTDERRLFILATTVGLFVALALIVWPLRRWLLARFIRDRHTTQPSFARRVVAAVVIGVARGVLPAGIISLPVLFFWANSVTPGIAGTILMSSLAALAFVVLVAGLARAAVAPFSPSAWRLAPLTDRAAIRLYRRIVILAIAVGAMFVVEHLAARHMHIPLELEVLYNFVGDTVVAILILLVLPARLWETRVEGDDESAQPRNLGLGRWLRTAFAFIAIAIPVSAVFGYNELSNYLTENLIFTGVVLGVMVLLHGLAHDVTSLVLEGESGPAAAIRQSLGFGDRSSRVLHFWAVAAFDLAQIIAGAIALLLIWGVPWTEMQDWLVTAVEGVRFGSFTLSITDLLVAVLVFVGILVATRALQRILEDRIFPQTRLDVGLRHSLKVATGYVGLILAAVLAIATLGLDLSSLAIIAGALSVGIGFGLQNIVNNFISGLILLVERPVKVGDWVVVGLHQGYVKRISVRATEIQCFDRSTVIVPNSELVSSAVTNWTHRDTHARVDIPVGVAYGSDTTRVRQVLVQCAREHPRVNAWPEPFVLFQDFGDNGLQFELRFFISQADEVFRVGSDVRFAIDQAFRDNGIEIPFPQRTVHVGDVERLERAVSRRDPASPDSVSPQAPYRALDPQRRDTGTTGD